MIYFYSFLQVIAVIFAVTGMAKKPGESASAIVTELESIYLKGEGITATFSLGSEKEVKLLVALHSTKYKLETSQEMTVNDGALIHRFSKVRNEVILDYARKKNTAVSTPVDLFNFSSNYTAKLLSSKANTYTLQLTPKGTISDIYKQAEIKSLIFELRRSGKGKPLQVVAITASGKGAKRKATNVMIAPVMKFTGVEFDFTVPKGVKVIDLTEE